MRTDMEKGSGIFRDMELLHSFFMYVWMKQYGIRFWIFSIVILSQYILICGFSGVLLRKKKRKKKLRKTICWRFAVKKNDEHNMFF